MTEKNAGIFIDTENLIGGYGRKGNRYYDLGATLTRVERHFAGRKGMGEPLEVRAYADWTREEIRRLRDKADELGVTRVQVAGSRHSERNAADIHLVVDALTWVREEAARDAQYIVIVSGDGGFLPAVKELQRQGKVVYVAASEDSVSLRLVRAADDFLNLAPQAARKRASIRQASERSVPTVPMDDQAWREFVLTQLGSALDQSESVHLEWLLSRVMTASGVPRPRDAHLYPSDLEAVDAALAGSPFETFRSEHGNVMIGARLPVLRGAGAPTLPAEPTDWSEHEPDDGEWRALAASGRILLPLEPE